MPILNLCLLCIANESDCHWAGFGNMSPSLRITINDPHLTCVQFRNILNIFIIRICCYPLKWTKLNCCSKCIKTNKIPGDDTLVRLCVHGI